MARNDELLREAIGDHDLDAARAALDAGADPDPVMWIALANAFDHGVEAIALLVERGASPDAREHDFATTPLMHLAGAGDLAAMQALLDRGADVEAEDQERRTALDWALTGGCWRVALRLAEAGARHRGSSDPDESEGPYRDPPPDRDQLARRCLPDAARVGRLDDVRAILDAAPALARDPVVMAETWTRAGAAADLLAVLELLEQRAATPPWEDADRHEVLVSRPAVGSVALIRHVVGRLAPLRDDERAALITRAAGEARDDVLAWLLGEVAATSAELDGGLLAAAGRGSGSGFTEAPDATAAARLLLDAGALVDARDPAGGTPLMHAAHRHDVPMMELLLARGADVAARDSLDRTAMAWADHLPGWPSADRKRGAIALLQRHGAASAPWRDDPALPPPTPPWSLWDKVQVGLFVFALLGIAFAIIVLRCA
jgi:Ankyrin repeats (many copies)